MITLFVMTLLLYAAAARCMPGVDWQVAGAFDDIGSDSFTTAYLNVSFVDPLSKYHNIKSEVGKFGDGHVGPAGGLLVHVTSTSGAHTGCERPFRTSLIGAQIPNQPWIALIQRGQCNFEVKVENAYREGAAAVIVYNDRESPTLDKMKLQAKDRNMSAVFTFKWKGEELARLVDGGTQVYVLLSVATHCTRPSAHINRTSVLFVSISFIVLMIISLAWLVFYYVQRFRYMHAKDRLSKRLGSAAKRALSKIPTKQVASEDKEVQGDECCAVCIEPYKITDDLRVLPCSHEFHRSCIDPWLLEHRTCPMCKMDILKYYGFVFTGSQESILQVEDDRPQALDPNDLFHGGIRGAPSGVRSEPVSRVGSPTLQVQGQLYTLQSVSSRDDCCVLCPHRTHHGAARSSRPPSSVHLPRPSSCLPDLDRTQLLLNGEAYCDSSSSSSSSEDVPVLREDLCLSLPEEITKLDIDKTEVLDS